MKSEHQLDQLPENLSLPSWERGLKWLIESEDIRAVLVAPFVGAWIEINLNSTVCIFNYVAPFVGAWIEIDIF